MYLTFMWISIVELDSCSDSGRDTYSARDHPTNCDADPLWSRKVHSATESISSGITQNRPVRVTSKPAKGEGSGHRSEEHTSELQSHLNLVCRLLLEKKKEQYKEST